MAKMLTEEEVKKIEEQRELRDRAREAGSTAGMSWIEKERFNQQQLNNRFRQAHEEAMERKRMSVLANPGAETNTNFRHSVMHDAEVRAARAHEMDRLGKELATREEEARQKRYGMAEQGMEAARFNKEAAIRAAELQTASNEKIAGINKDSNLGVAKINAESQEKINKDKNDTAVEVAGINKEGTVESAQVTAAAQAAQQYAQDLMRRRQLKEKQAMAYAQTTIAKALQMVNATKRGGRATMTIEQALQKIDEENERMGTLPGRKLQDYRK